MEKEKLPPFPGAPLSMKGAPLVVVPVVLVLLALFFWFYCRIEPRAGEIAVLIRKTGTGLPSGKIIATEPGEKGIQLEVLPEGRYFRNPYTWSWRIHRITDIPAGKLGVLVRLYGMKPQPGEIIAREGEKGILREVLRPGKYRVNPYAYRVEVFDSITVRPGHVGVVTSLVGKDVLNSHPPEKDRNTFLVQEGYKGVQARGLDPGTYYLNPYCYSVTEVNLQSQRFAMSGEDAISFLTLDGFTVHVEGTIEWGITRGHAALLTHRVGDMDDILQKIILPRARGFSRIEGSKKPAVDYIVGETRQQFQDNLFAHLKRTCEPWGVSVRSTLIRNIIPPDEIASVIRQREVAVQNRKKYEQQIIEAKSEAELARQDMLAVQNKEKVQAETKKIRAVISARQAQAVDLTRANRELGVARLENDAADFQVEARLAKGEADRDVIRLRNEARAAVFKESAAAFGGGDAFARYTLYQKLGPKISRVFTTDEGSLGEVFGEFLPPGAKKRRAGQ